MFNWIRHSDKDNGYISLMLVGTPRMTLRVGVFCVGAGVPEVPLDGWWPLVHGWLSPLSPIGLDW